LKAGTEDTSIDALENAPPRARPLEEVANEVPSQFHVFETPFTRWVSLNENIPPFNDVRVRRAINFAVDRRAMAEVLGAPLTADVTCQILPPGILGHVPYCPYTKNAGEAGIWTGPDLEEAKRLVAESGTRGARITLWMDPGNPAAHVIELVADAMRAIGYKPVIRRRDGFEIFATALDDPKQYQSIMAGWFADLPAPSNFTIPSFSCPDFADRIFGRPDSSANIQFFCDRTIDDMIEQALAAQEKDVLASADLWAAIDHAIVDAAPSIPYGTQRIATLVSARVGNVQYNPMTFLLFTQMWLTDRK
jgi:peptide/nickel transport system substrate-binding protein